jgi:hypothetical protein
MGKNLKTLVLEHGKKVFGLELCNRDLNCHSKLV